MGVHFREDRQGQGPPGVEDELTQHAQMREEREGEIRLYFRNVPADRVANYFRSLGAQLITLMAERSPESDTPAEAETSEAEPNMAVGTRRKRKPAPHDPGGARTSGELTMRYFFALGELLYTVDLVVPSGVVESISAIYPSAGRLEREAAERMAAVIRT
ncbi:MAG: hypothetical protein M3014_12820 [Chloroflexota bacterium]|nr:hypothetical protein [Chloroflexota bacterium]